MDEFPYTFLSPLHSKMRNACPKKRVLNALKSQPNLSRHRYSSGFAYKWRELMREICKIFQKKSHPQKILFFIVVVVVIDIMVISVESHIHVLYSNGMNGFERNFLFFFQYYVRNRRKFLRQYLSKIWIEVEKKKPFHRKPSIYEKETFTFERISGYGVS